MFGVMQRAAGAVISNGGWVISFFSQVQLYMEGIINYTLPIWGDSASEHRKLCFSRDRCRTPAHHPEALTAVTAWPSGLFWMEDCQTYEKYYYTPVRHLIKPQILLVSRIARKYLLSISGVIITYGRIYGRLYDQIGNLLFMM